MLLWGLSDHFVDELIQLYPSRAQAERALRTVLSDEPEWEGMLEVVPVTLERHCRAWDRPSRVRCPVFPCRRG